MRSTVAQESQSAESRDVSRPVVRALLDALLLAALATAFGLALLCAMSSASEPVRVSSASSADLRESGPRLSESPMSLNPTS